MAISGLKLEKLTKTRRIVWGHRIRRDRSSAHSLGHTRLSTEYRIDLSHSQIALTADLYVHLFMSVARAAMSGMDAALSPVALPKSPRSIHQHVSCLFLVSRAGLEPATL